MKILYYHQYFTTPSYGGGTRSYEFAQQLIKRGHQVTLVCGENAKLNLAATDVKGIFRGNIDGIDVIQISLQYSNHDSIPKRVLTFWKFGWLGVKIASKEEFDLLFATSTPLTAGIPGVVMKWFRKKKFVFEVRDLWPELPKALGMKNPFLLGAMSILERVSYRKADACIGLSPGICEGIAKRSQKNKRIAMIPNGCDLDIFKPGARADLVLEGVEKDDIVAVFTGAHGIANGLDAVLDGAKVLLERGRTDIKFVFIGDGKLKSKLQKRAENDGLVNCLFFDPMPKTELNAIVSNVDIGLMILANVPAFYYGTSPNKFFDYISSGLPVFNNYPGWLADMIIENGCGIAVAPDDANVFADGMIFLADNPQKRVEFGKNSRSLAGKEFDRDILSNKFVDFLESINGESNV